MTGLPGASNTSAYSVKSAFHYDAVTKSIVWPCTASLKSYVPSTPCREATSESCNVINHVLEPWGIALLSILEEQRDKFGSFFPGGYPCNVTTELSKAKSTSYSNHHMVGLTLVSHSIPKTSLLDNLSTT